MNSECVKLRMILSILRWGSLGGCWGGRTGIAQLLPLNGSHYPSRIGCGCHGEPGRAHTVFVCHAHIGSPSHKQVGASAGASCPDLQHPTKGHSTYKEAPGSTREAL